MPDPDSPVSAPAPLVGAAPQSISYRTSPEQLAAAERARSYWASRLAHAAMLEAQAAEAARPALDS